MSEVIAEKRKKPKVIGLKALFAKKYDFLEGLDSLIERSFGRLVMGFIMFIWAQSSSGKSNFVVKFVRALMKYGNVLYVGLEEGVDASMQLMALRHLNEEEHSGKIFFADHEMTYEELRLHLKKKKSPKIIVIDSLQYWDINYSKYKRLKEEFPKKIFIFISHAKGKEPDGTHAKKIRYDAAIKVWVEGGVAFPKMSRYGGNKPFISSEEMAIDYWGKKKVNQFKK